ncbi:MAG: MlaD family protein [Fusobacteria bacterium]|nr:MlaD family protein [Fusobacteriota bacterium]
MEKKKNLYVGIFIIACIAVLIGLLVMVQQLNVFNKSYSVNVVFENIGTITNGTPVLLNGVQVGKVSTIALDDNSNDVVVTLSVNNGVKIRKGAQFRIVMKGIMGDSRINIINPAVGDQYYQNGDEVVGAKTISMDTLIQNLNNSILLFNSIAGKINDLPFANLATAIDQLNVVMANMATATANANTLITNSNNLVTNATSVLDVNKGQIAQILNQLNSVVANLNTMTGGANKQNVQDIIVQTDALIKNLNELLDSNTSGSSTTSGSSAVPLKTSIKNLSKMTAKVTNLLDNDVSFNVTGYGIGGPGQNNATNGSNAVGSMSFDVKNRHSDYFVSIGGDGVFDNQLKAKALVGKYLDNDKFSFGAGIIENTPGGQVTYQYLPNLMLKAQAFNFQNGKLQLINQYNIGDYNLNLLYRSDQVYGAGIGYTF